MASYVMCMWLINPAHGLADLVSPLNDHAALEKEVAKVRSRRQPVRTPQTTPGKAGGKSATAQGLLSLLAGARMGNPHND